MTDSVSTPAHTHHLPETAFKAGSVLASEEVLKGRGGTRERVAQETVLGGRRGAAGWGSRGAGGAEEVCPLVASVQLVLRN